MVQLGTCPNRNLEDARVKFCPHLSPRQRRSYGKVIVVRQAPTKKPGNAGLSLLTIHY